MPGKKKKEEEEKKLKEKEQEEEIEEGKEKEEEKKEKEEEKPGLSIGIALVGLAAFIVMGLAAYVVALKVVAPRLAGKEAVAWEMEPVEQNLKMLEESGKAETDKGDEGETPSENVPQRVGTIYEIKDLIVNLADEEDRYLKIGIAVELDNPKSAQEMNRREAIIKDALISTLSSKHSTEISDAEGKENLRKELVEKLNALLPAKGVKGVYFTDFVIQ